MRGQPLVLVVDDDPFIRRVLRSRLEAQAYAVNEVELGGHALEAVRTLRPDAVLLDVMLPDMNGLEVCTRIRREPDLAGIPILFLSAAEDVGTKAAGFELGGQDYITKSCDPRELDVRIKVAITAKLQREELLLTAQQLAKEKEHLVQEALRDPLTGLWNRRFLEERGTCLLEEAFANGQSMVVLMLDVDHFKRVNDRLGHAAGDAVLKLVAEQLRGAVREQDFCARYGGEEFCVLLPASGAEVGGLIGERIRARVEDMEAWVGNDLVLVTLSVGVATFPVDGIDLATLIHTADSRLYRAKQAGRNRVVYVTA